MSDIGVEAVGPSEQQTETFSYLPPLDADQLAAQVNYLVGRGLIPAVEHVEPERATLTYWYMWKLPLFGVADPEVVLAELSACHHANPGHFVRLIGYDNRRQTQGFSLVVYRGK
jgi:ribulose-bisphosphate carboxylase small chain